MLTSGRCVVLPGAPGSIQAQLSGIHVLASRVVHAQLACTVQLPDSHCSEELGVAANGVPADIQISNALSTHVTCTGSTHVTCKPYIEVRLT